MKVNYEQLKRVFEVLVTIKIEKVNDIIILLQELHSLPPSATKSKEVLTKIFTNSSELQDEPAHVWLPSILTFFSDKKRHKSWRERL